MHRVRQIVFIVKMLFVLSLYSVQGQTLSPQAKVSLITVEPGQELYSGFGHSTFWIYDPSRGIDRIYNYGTFDFNPDFYMKFVRGKLDYMLSVSNMEYLMYGAMEEKRTVVEQVLNLSPVQREDLFKFLETNYLPENRYYRYDFFLDNCSSRLRDVLRSVCRDSLRFNLSHDSNLSFRQLIDQYLQQKKIQDLGMDIGLGAPADRKATPFEYMFLPDYLKSAFDSAKIYRNNHWESLVLRKSILYQAPEVQTSGSVFSPALFFWALFLLSAYLTYRNIKKGKESFLADSVLLVLLSLLGFLLVFLWFFTDHNVTIHNWNLWWATPLHLPVAFLLIRRSAPLVLRWYFLVYAVVCFSLIAFWKVLPEEFNVAIFPLLLLLGMRSLYISNYFKTNNDESEPGIHLQAGDCPDKRSSRIY